MMKTKKVIKQVKIMLLLQGNGLHCVFSHEFVYSISLFMDWFS